ncbi:MAG TPA: DDE-type integrase/transposase/recombinase [Burkholderiaceae bacterium]|nr:DDE-type integrase/transposase/recombinase [Burkholderiaceae bacterium]
MNIVQSSAEGSEGRSFRPGLVAEIWAHLDHLNVSPECRAYIKEALEAPSRQVRSTPRSMCGRYPSKKVGVTISFESATLELPIILALEQDPNVLLYVDQPPAIKLTYRIGGRMRSYLQTPDFLAIMKSGILLLEGRRLAAIEERAINDPELFVLQQGRWTCPPAKRATQELGMSHEVRTEANFDAVVLSNQLFLGEYLRADLNLPGYDVALAAITNILGCLARATIRSVLDRCGATVTLDHIYRAIGCGDVAIDWQACRIVDAEGCWIYRDTATLHAYLACALSKDRRQGPPVNLVRLAAQEQLEWDGQTWKLLTVGASQALIECEGRTEAMPLTTLTGLARAGQLKSLGTAEVDKAVESPIDAILRRARRTELEEANRRMEQIRPYLQARRGNPQHRTLRRYLSDYRAAQRKHGNGFIGLLPKTAQAGNRQKRLLKAVLQLAHDVAHEHLLNPDNVRVKIGWGFLSDRCEERGLPTPSYPWFNKFVKRMPAYQVARARGGDKLAYALEPRVESTDLALAMAPDRAWQRAHIDHTLIDLETIFSNSPDKAGRVWVTVMIDHHSRRVLAVSLSYEAPSYRSVMAVIRDCVRRWGRLPESLVLDGGKEFQCVWTQTLCARYHVTLIYRPAAKPRYGSQMERFFGTLNTNLIHVLKGNTQLRKNVRQMTNAVDPDNFAVWTFPELCDLLEKYLCHVYDSLEHRELLMSPRACFETSVAQSGHRPMHVIPYDRHFILATCPSPRKGTARVQADGVKVHYLYYNAAQLQAHFGKDVEVRYDPGNMGVAFAYIDREWVRLTCTRHAKTVWGLTEKELLEASTEWRRRRSAVEKTRLTDAALIKFLKEVNAEQLMLLRRRQAAEERKRLMEANVYPADWEDWDEPAGTMLLGSSDVPAADTYEPNVEAAKPSMKIQTLEAY